MEHGQATLHTAPFMLRRNLIFLSRSLSVYRNERYKPCG
jgi:hypothetical protein